MSAAETGHHAAPASGATLQGWKAALADEAGRLDVLEKAFDFRGDCTLTLTDGSVVSGYIFDRRRGPTSAASTIRLMPADRDEKLTIGYDRIAAVEFGKDTAHGKSFETWIKKYIEKKLKGEKASIESDPL